MNCVAGDCSPESGEPVYSSEYIEQLLVKKLQDKIITKVGVCLCFISLYYVDALCSRYLQVDGAEFRKSLSKLWKFDDKLNP